MRVAEGYVAEVLIPWGQPLLSGGPAWRKDASNTAAEQAQQIGMHHDGMHFYPLRAGRHDGGDSERGLLVLNHEYVDRTLLYTDGDSVVTKEKVDKALAAHGVTVIEIALVDGSWTAVDSSLNRRITMSDTDGLLRSGAGRSSDAVIGARQPRPGHAQQLCPRLDALGHVPDVRGELARLLRHAGPVVGTEPGRGQIRASAPPAPATAGTWPTSASTWLGIATRSTVSAGWWRSIPSIRRPHR